MSSIIQNVIQPHPKSHPTSFKTSSNIIKLGTFSEVLKMSSKAPQKLLKRSSDTIMITMKASDKIMLTMLTKNDNNEKKK